ncbi:MAG: DNA-binding proteins Bright/BRCAA1/RBP1 and proteins containing BRIGHT domain [Stictis urceolatum]|nr:DNA-binding proteins Bright/BRCAA1/RBP1 and proteins containing BRIGHT domain [Stictis urceolata]
MATNNKTSTSSIAMALAGKTASVDIPKPYIGSIVTAAKSAPGKPGAGLLTPPNSISPSLPPQHLFKEREHSAPPTPPGQGAESDIDLQDAVEHAAAQDRPQHRDPKIRGSADVAGAVTPTILATHHLPDVLLLHGPLAIRHIMGHLTNTVPGFSRIAPAKARRLVVGALEGRGGTNGEAAGGLDGDVLFEKVGWGRWDARKRGQPLIARRQASPITARHPHGASFRSPSPYASRTLRIPHRPATGVRKVSSNSLAFSHQSQETKRFGVETEADKMSLDGISGEDNSMTSSEADEDLSDVTDEEDWAGVGAAALRSGSFPKEMLHTRPGKRLDPDERMRRGTEPFQRRTPSSGLATSAPGYREKVGGWMQSNAMVANEAPSINEHLMEGVGADESEAVKALLQMGGV